MIAEPVTLITDWLLAALCLVLGLRLKRHAAGAGRRSVVLLAGSFLATAIGAFVGGASHGFEPHLGARGNALLWKATLLAIGVTALLFVTAAAVSALTGTARRVVAGLAVAQAALYSSWMLFHDDFIYVIANYVPAMLVVLGLQVLQLRRGESSAPWIVAGILTSFAGSGIQASGLALHEHFNHNDLYHVVQMVAVWMLYRGGLELRDRVTSRRGRVTG